MSQNTKYDLYCWACDFSPNRGEGILARHYIQSLSKKKQKKFFIKSTHGTFSINKGLIKKLNTTSRNMTKLNLSFFENYLYPIYGIIYLWINYFRKRGVCYLNFLPLWNTFLFILLPPNTHLGPITGFIYKKKVFNINSFFRKYISLILFKININILYNRQNVIYFSTDLLKPLIKKKFKNKFFFNYLLQLVNIRKYHSKKNIDFVIYNRNYSVKNNFLRNKLLKCLNELKLNIIVVGDYLSYSKIRNLGFVSRKKISSLLKKTKFIINSGENPYNIFTIDAFNINVNIIYENIFFDKIKFFSKNKLLFLNFKNNKKNNIFFKNKKNFFVKPSSITKDYSTLKRENISYFNKVKINYTSKFNKI